MRIKVNCRDLLAALTVVAPLAASSSASELSAIAFKASPAGLTLQGTDLRDSADANVPIVEGDYDEGEMFCAHPDSLIRILSTLLKDESISIVTNKRTADLEFANKRTSVPLVPWERWPDLQARDLLEVARVPSHAISSGLRRTMYAVGTKRAQGVMAGVNVAVSEGRLCFTATDTALLSQFAEAVEYEGEPFSCVIPSDMARVVRDMASATKERMEIRYRGAEGLVSQVSFATEAGEVTCAVLDGAYPDVERMFAKQNNSYMIFPKDRMAEALERALAVSDFAVDFSVSNYLCNVRSHSDNGQVYEEALDITADVANDDSSSFSANGTYLQKILSSIDSCEVRLEFEGRTRPLKIFPLESPEGVFHRCALSPLVK